MVKTVFKEIIIILLLCLAIIVVLGLLLYDYVPMSKVIPEPVSYTTPEDVKQELKDAENIDDSQVIMTYEVNSSDLNNYKNINKYNPGKANPFSSYEENVEPENKTDNKTTTTTKTSSEANKNTKATGTANNVSSSKETTAPSEGHFFQDKGTK